MANAEERLKILTLLQEGKITADQAARLLEALETASTVKAGTRPTPPTMPPFPPAQSGSGRWLRVRVTDTDTGKTRVNIRMPLSLVRSGIKMGARFVSPEIEGLDENTLMEFVSSGEVGQIIDVYDEEDGEHVEVYIE